MRTDVLYSLGEPSFAVVKVESVRLGTIRVGVHRKVIEVSLGKGDVAVPAGFQSQFSPEGPAPQFVVVGEMNEADVSVNQTLDCANNVVLWLELRTQDT